MSWSAQVWIKWKPGAEQQWDQWDWLQQWSEVKTSWSTMGEWDMALWVEASNPEQLEEFVWKKLRSNEWVGDTKTTWWHPVWEKKAA